MKQRTAGLTSKWGWFIVLIFIVAAVGFPFLKGVVLERAVKQSIDRLNQDLSENGQGTLIGMKAWDKGWLNSTVEWHIQSDWIKSLTGDDRVILLERLSHGYGGRIVSNTSLEKNGWYKDLVDRHLGGIDPLTINTTYTLKGDIQSQLRLDGFSITDLSVKPGSAVITWEQALNRINWQLAWEGLQKRGALSIAGLKLSTQAEKATDMIWAGKTNLSLTSLTMTDDHLSISLDNLSADYGLDYDRNASSLFIDMTLSLDEIHTDRASAWDMGAAIGLSNLDARGVEELIRLNLTMKSALTAALFRLKNNPGAFNKVFETHMGKLGQALPGLWEQFLRKGFQLRVSGLSATLNEGDITADISVGLKRSITLAGFLPLMINPSMITDFFSLTSDIRMPYELVGYQPNLLSPLYQGMQTGLFVIQEGNMIHEAQIRDGKLFLNKEEVLFE